VLDLNQIIVNVILQINPNGRQILLHLLLILIIFVEFHLAAEILLLIRRRLSGSGAETVGIISFILKMLLQFTALRQWILQDVTFGLETFTLQVNAPIHNLLLLSKEFLC
jgi:hypothetical protein